MIGMDQPTAPLFVLLENAAGYLLVPMEEEATISDLETKYGGRFEEWFASRQDAEAKRRVLQWRNDH